MKNVGIYKRVSSDEQVLGYSIASQDERLRKYCEQHGLNIVFEFTEDHSAKSFNRPEFKKLHSFVKQNKGVVDTLLFINWSRFSRNATDALMMIRELKQRGVDCVAIDQPLDFDVPESKIMLAIYVTTPEVDNDRRSLSISDGIRRSLKEGRYCNTAPYGYKYSRDERNKPILVIDEPKAVFVQEAFALLGSGAYSKYQIMEMMQKKGMKMEKSRFCLMFHIPLYCGKVLIKAHKNEPERLIPGVHEPIISEDLYQKVQRAKDPKKSLGSKLVTAREELPLRGHLICPLCGKNLTGSASTGRNGKHFYYHCLRGCPARFKAQEVNEKFESWLEQISLKPDLRDEYLSIFDSIYKREEGDRKQELKNLKDKIKAVEDCLLKVDKKFVNDEIDMDSYKRLKDSYNNDLTQLKIKRDALDEVEADFMHQMEFALSVISNLHVFWSELDVIGKRSLIGSIFPEKIIYDGKKYRTALAEKTIPDIFNIGAGLAEKENGAIVISDDHSVDVERSGAFSNHFAGLMDRLEGLRPFIPANHAAFANFSRI